jgi:hypothetical protein
MSINPLIELARDPVAAFAWLGYVALLVGVALYGGIWVFRTWTTVYIRWRKNRHTDEWWGGWVPPAHEAALLAAGCLVCAVIAWAAGALIWLLG